MRMRIAYSLFLVADTRLYTLLCRSVRLSVRRSVRNIFEFRAVFDLLLLPNRPRLDCRVSGLVCQSLRLSVDQSGSLAVRGLFRLTDIPFLDDQLRFRGHISRWGNSTGRWLKIESRKCSSQNQRRVEMYLWRWRGYQSCTGEIINCKWMEINTTALR